MTTKPTEKWMDSYLQCCKKKKGGTAWAPQLCSWDDGRVSKAYALAFSEGRIWNHHETMDVVFPLGQCNVLLIYVTVISCHCQITPWWACSGCIISVHPRQLNGSNRIQRELEFVLEHGPIKVMMAAWNETGMAVALNQIGVMVQSEWSIHAYRHHTQTHSLTIYRGA